METKTFNKFRALVYKISGISLSEQKMALVSSRIGKRMRFLGISEYQAYYQRVLDDSSGLEMREMINAISTNVTHFFREDRHFDFMAEVLRNRAKEGQKQFNIWCAACSTGEEPYSIGITANEVLSNPAPVKIIGSDISTKVLQIAKFGVYKEDDIASISKPVLKRYFKKGMGRAESLYRIKPELRDMMEFKQINLSTPPYPVTGGFDFIFCRNVMIYFNNELRQILVDNFQSLLKPDGYLIVGMSESLNSTRRNLKSIEASVYQNMSGS